VSSDFRLEIDKYKMRIYELLESAIDNDDPLSGKRRGRLSQSPIRNEGVIGELEDALCLWGMGETEKATPILMALKKEASRFPCYQKVLFRGITISPEKVDAEDLTIHTDPSFPLVSWSTSIEEVIEFMHGWNRPYVILSAPTKDLNVYIDLVEFDRDAKPVTEMTSQKEVIVYMPQTMVFPRQNCVFFTDIGRPASKDDVELLDHFISINY